MGLKERYAYRVVVRNLKERDCLENLGIDGRIILKGTLQK
jgi:hypothetical protein